MKTTRAKWYRADIQVSRNSSNKDVYFMSWVQMTSKDFFLTTHFHYRVVSSRERITDYIQNEGLKILNILRSVFRFSDLDLC